jgi:hypothetical protein
MHKSCENGMKIFVCAYRNLKIKILVSSFSTIALESYKSILEPSDETVMLRRPQVDGGYEIHRSKSELSNEQGLHYNLPFRLS